MYGGPRRNLYHPALDGLRTTAVVAVVLFHAGVARARGGFLGVSLFFTLSGFLITRLLLTERARDGRIALAAFWGRRVRRLAPAALLCLLAVLASSRWLVTPIEMRSLRGDIVASAANVANWRFLTAGQSYAQLFAGRPSPVLHFWSLAIEEQFYFVFPCVMALLLALRRRWAVPVGLAVLALGSLVATLAAHDHDLVYYGTHTRAGELLVGALMAWWLDSHPSVFDHGRPRRLLGVAAMAGSIGMVALVVTAEQSDRWLYRGGLIAVTLVWCPMIVAATTTTGWARVLGWRPLAAVGRRSYGIYVFHWPVFVLVRPHELHLHGWVARLAQVAIIATLTEGSYRLVERPIRERRVLAGAVSMRGAALSTVAAVIAVALVLPAANSSGPQISMLDAPDTPVLLTPSNAPVQQLDATGGNAGSDAASAVASHPVAPSSPAPSSPAPSSPSSSAPSSSAVMALPAATQRPLRVAVIGSDLSIARSLNGAVADLAGVRMINGVIPNCTPIDFNDPWPLDPGCPNPPAPAPISDVLIVALGPTDHAAFADRMTASLAFSATQQYAISRHLGHLGVAAFERFAEMASTVVVVDTMDGGGDFLDAVLDEAVVSTTTLSRHRADEIDTAFVAGLLAPDVPRPALRILVVGDSTSYGVATGLAASTEQLEVLWAGKRNCPLIPVDSTMLVDVPTSAAGCPDVHSSWADAVRSFHPDVVLAVASLPEEAEQRYVGDAQWYEPGSPRYTAEHDGAMRDLIALAASSGAVIEVATAPSNPTTGHTGWTAPAGIDAWNAQIRSWDAQSPVVETLGYGSLVEAAETAVGHSLRPDGTHLDDASVTAIVGGSLAPLLVQQATALRATLTASGCLVAGPGGNRLDLGACG